MITTLLTRAGWVAVFLPLAAAVWWLMPVLPRATLPTGCWILCLSPDGRFLATRHEGRVLVWDVARAQPTVELPYAGWPNWDFTFSADGHWLAGSGGGQFKIWELPAGRETASVPTHEDAPASPVFSPAGQWLAFRVEGPDRTQQLMVWDLARRCERAALPGSRGEMGPILFLWSPDGQRLAFESVESQPASPQFFQLHLWNAEKGQEEALSDNNPGPWRLLAFSPDGRTLATGELPGPRGERPHQVQLWDLGTGKAGAPWQLPGSIWELRFTGDGSRLLATLHSFTTRPVTAWRLALIDPNAEPPAGIALTDIDPDAIHSADGRLMATGTHSPGASVSILELPAAKERVAIEAEPEDEPYLRAFSRDGQFLAVLTVSRNSTPISNWLRRVCGLNVAPASPQGPGHIVLSLYATATGQPQGAVPVHNSTPALFTLDGQTLVAMTPDDRPAIWDVPLHKPWPRIVAWWSLLAVAFAGAGFWLRRRGAAGRSAAVVVPRSEKAER
jgi:WD40 repeat protein